MNLIYAFLGVYCLYELQKYLYIRCWNKKLSVIISFSKVHVSEGEDCVLTETVLNQKILPVPILKVKFMASRHLDFYDMDNSKVTDNYYRSDLLSVMMFQRLTRNISFRCSHRGYYTIDKVFLVSTDLFLVSEYAISYDINVNLYVYPRLVDNDKLQVPFDKILGTVISKRFINEDPFEFKSIREYQSYDAIKTINWKASAKASSLLVNVFDYTAAQQIKILLNLEPVALRKQEELLEESIRIAATLAAKFIEQGVPTAFDTNGPDIITKMPIPIPAGSGLNHVRSINETLARIDTSLDFPPFLPILQKELLNSNHNDYIVLISSYHREDLQLFMTSMLNSKMDFIWIIPYNNEVSINISHELVPYVLEWELTDSYKSIL